MGAVENESFRIFDVMVTFVRKLMNLLAFLGTSQYFQRNIAIEQGFTMRQFQQRSPSGLPQQIYIDIFWVMELFCVVFLTSFSLNAAYLLPLQYCDLIHRCAAHLGKWERLDRLTMASTAGSNNIGGSGSYYNTTSISGSSSSDVVSGGDDSSALTANSTATNSLYLE